MKSDASYYKVIVKFLLLVLLLEFVEAQSGVTFNGPKCYQRVCKRGEFCSDIDRTCRDCGSICDRTTHNYDEPLCVKNCQDYIHDSLYVLKNDNGSGNNENLRATVQRLSHMVTVVLTLVCLMLVGIVAVICIQVYRWKQKKNLKLSDFKNKFFSKKSNNANQDVAQPANPKADLRLEMPIQTSHSDRSPVTVTTSISRRPAEDSTLDYAYDNPAMASPSPTSKSENKF